MKNKKNPFRIRRIGRRPGNSKIKTGLRTILKVCGLFFLTIGLTLIVYFNKQSGDWFKSSVLDLPEPFNGTVMPVEKIPNWTLWKGDSTETHYRAIPSEMMIDLPTYDLSVLAFPLEKLEWGNPAHDLIRNTLITYSVVYLGSYEKNHTEDVGSHLAVDIKMPQGTPVRAIANGKVIKATMKESGFGHHIVIKHIDVPDPANPGQLTTLYSGYNHLNEVLVVEGQNVLKAEEIGTSGNTGTSTTPHLHLQIDRDSAPWHPYWPFTWQEAQSAGLSFFEAVNAGLGLSKARELTINPMPFIMQNLNYSQVTSDSAVVTPQSPSENQLPEPMTASSEPIVTNPKEATAASFDPSLLEFDLEGETIGLLNNGVTILVKDHRGVIEKLGDTDSIPVQLQGVGTALFPKLLKTDFTNGVAQVIIKSEIPGESTVIIGKSSHSILFVERAKNAAALRVEHDGAFTLEVVELVKVVAVDENGNPSPTINFSGEIEITVIQGQASVIPSRLEAKDFKNGVAELRVKSSRHDPLVIRAQNGALVGESAPLNPENPQIFTDIDQNHPNYEAIKYLKNEGILNGYPDGSFQPDQSVNRVEALKMLMLAFDVSATAGQPLPFSDTDESAWYGGALAAALEKAIVKGYPDGTFRPAQTVNRAEYLKIFFNSAEENPDEVSLIARPYEDVSVSDWFAVFAYLANRKNLLPDSNSRLRPSEGMTRAIVAETIYRMKMIEKEGMVSYSK